MKIFYCNGFKLAETERQSVTANYGDDLMDVATPYVTQVRKQMKKVRVDPLSMQIE